MHLRGIDFGYVMNASGARNFFGDGYWFHPKLLPFGLDYTGSTFVAKTTTLYYRGGNMSLHPITLQPLERFPASIKVRFANGSVLNAVGLSGFGVLDLLERGVWQLRRDPFFISFAAVRETAAERLYEWRRFVSLLEQHLRGFHALVGLEMNFTCPNTGVEKPFVKEILAALDIAATLGIPLVVKLNVLMPPEIAMEIERHCACDAICQSNTIPWGQLPDQINWKKIFGRVDSPLKEYGGGGLSGPYLFPLVRSWIQEARRAGIKKPIIACGGIMSVECADMMFAAGASAIQLGSVSIVRPWRVKSIIRRANQYKATEHGA